MYGNYEIGYLKWDGSKFTTDTTVQTIGPQGAKGPTGPIGLQGIQGIQGIQGVQGIKGEDFILLSNDLSGNLSSQNVIGLYGNPFDINVYNINSNDDGYSLVWDNSTTSWKAKRTITISGDLSGTVYEQTIIKIMGTLLDESLASLSYPDDSKFITWSNSDAYWKAYPASGVAGDLTQVIIGEDTVKSVIGIRGKTLNSALSSIGSPQNNYSLMWSNSNNYWRAYPIFIADGDLSGTMSSQTIERIQGKSLHTNLASLGANEDGYSLIWNNSDAYWKALPIFTAGGDISGNSTSQTVSKIKGKTVSASVSALGAAQDGYALSFSNSDAYWRAYPVFTPAGDLSGTVTSQTVIGLRGKSLNSSLASVSNNGYQLTWQNSTNSWIAQAPSTSVLQWGCATIGTGSNISFMYPGYDHTAASTTEIHFYAPRSGIIKNLFVYQNDVGSSVGDPIDTLYVLNKNGDNTSLSILLPLTSIFDYNNIDTVSVNAGDRLSFMILYSEVATSPSRVIATVEFAALA